MSLPLRLSRYLRQPLVAVLVAVLFLTGSPVVAKDTLPKPHVSPALDAVLLPITAAVRKEFKLGKKAAGAVVVSVEPNGIAELYGLEPGDVITELNDKIIRRPVDIDSMIKYGLNGGQTFFFFEGTRKNRAKKTIIELATEDYARPVPVADVPRWRGYSNGSRGARGNGYRGDDGYFYTGGGFYYADFCDAYYDDFYEVYDYTIIYVEEVIYTEVYITSIESSETVFYYDETVTGYDWPDEDYISEVDDYVYSEEFYAEYSSEEVYYEDDAYDPETGLSYDEAEELGYIEDGSSAEVYEETATDEYYEEPVAEEYYEEPVADEYYEEPVADEYYEEPVADGYYEEPVAEEYYEEPVAEEYYEEPVAEEYYEEPVAEEYYEEPVYEEYYEEPVAEEYYEEPVYEEPAYEDAGGGCTYDEYGNEYC